MCQTTHLKILDLVTFSDLTLTLTCAKYETISLVSTFAWSLGVHMESFGRNMLRLRSLRSATWKHSILTFDLTLTWHVTSILNFRKWFGSVSSRSFECCLVRLSTSIRFRDSRGGGSDPTPPPGCGGYRNSPGGGGLTRAVLGSFHNATCLGGYFAPPPNIFCSAGQRVKFKRRLIVLNNSSIYLINLRSFMTSQGQVKIKNVWTFAIYRMCEQNIDSKRKAS